MIIRHANIEDLADLLKLSREAQETRACEFPHTFRNTPYYEIKGWFISQLESKDVFIFTACREEEIIGYVVMRLMPHPDNPLMHGRWTACIDQICVGQSGGRSDIGKRLLEHAAAHAKAKGYEMNKMGVQFDNHGSTTELVKHGFST